MASNLNITLNGAVAQVINGNDSTTRVITSLGNPTLGASQSAYDDFLLVPNGAGTIIAPYTMWVVYVKNLGGINSTPAGNITIRMTVAGGAQIATADSPVIPPGGVFLYWQTSESAGGITAFTLIASVNNTPVELLVAG